MKSALLAPHDDDQVLFAAYTLMREKPTVFVVLDSYIQPNRGETGCSAEERAKESAIACEMLGVPIKRFRIRDDATPKDQLWKGMAVGFKELAGFDRIYIPAKQGGNFQHDLVNEVAGAMYTYKTVEYTTYTKTQLYTTGNKEVVPTDSEVVLKNRAMECFQSQLRVNRPHFDAVKGKSEWLNVRGPNCLHLGCGSNVVRGWMNVDLKSYYLANDAELAYWFKTADVTNGIPFETNSFDYCYTEDFLEHLPADKRVFVINEIHRVVKNGGFMEHFVPNAGSCNAFGSPSHLSFWNQQTFDHFDVDSYRWKKDHVFEGITARFKKVYSDLVNWQKEEDEVFRAQSIHVKYQAVK